MVACIPYARDLHNAQVVQWYVPPVCMCRVCFAKALRRPTIRLQKVTADGAIFPFCKSEGV